MPSLLDIPRISYTAEEVDEIVASMQSLEGANPEWIRDQVSRVRYRVFDWRRSVRQIHRAVDVRTERLDELTQAVETLLREDTLREVRRIAFNLGFPETGAQTRDAALTELELARPHLVHLADVFRRARASDYTDRAVTERLFPTPAGRTLLFQQQVIAAAARFWEGCGGTVTFGSEYRRYFRAAVRPVLTHELARAVGCSWSGGSEKDNVPDGDSVFRRHVRQWTQAQGTKRPRGRPRKKSF